VDNSVCKLNEKLSFFTRGSAQRRERKEIAKGRKNKGRMRRNGVINKNQRGIKEKEVTLLYGKGRVNRTIVVSQFTLSNRICDMRLR